MTAAPDTVFVVGPDFQQLDDKDILVTPAGGVQQTLAEALAAAAGTVVRVDVQSGPFLIANSITATGTVQNSASTLTLHGPLIGQGASAVAAMAVGTSGQIVVGQTGADPLWKTMSGDATLNNTGALGLVATGVTAGKYGDATHVAQVTFDAAGRALTASSVAITGISASAVNVGTTTIGGGTTTRVLFDNAGTLGEYTISGSGNVAMTTSPTLTTPALGTPSAAVLTSATGLPLTTGVTGLLPFANIATLAASSLFGNGAVSGATGGNVAIGSGLSLSVAGTLTATGSGGSVTSVITAAGPFLANTTITTAGTLTGSVSTLTNHGVLVGQAAAAPVATAVGTDGQLFLGQSAADPAWGTMSGDGAITKAGVLSLGSVVAGGTVGSASLIPVITYDTKGRITATTTAAVPVTAAGVGAVLNSGTVSINNSTTLTGTAAGTVTIAPTTGTSDVILNMPAGGGTVTVAAAPSFARQRCELDIKQGATAGIVTLNSGFVFGTSGGPTSYTAGTVVSSVDRLMLLSPDGTKWAVMAINQGFTV